MAAPTKIATEHRFAVVHRAPGSATKVITGTDPEVLQDWAISRAAPRDSFDISKEDRTILVYEVLSTDEAPLAEATPGAFKATRKARAARAAEAEAERERIAAEHAARRRFLENEIAGYEREGVEIDEEEMGLAVKFPRLARTSAGIERAKWRQRAPQIAEYREELARYTSSEDLTTASIDAGDNDKGDN